MNISAYIRLARLHQPAGILLLLWPCWWALALASNGLPPLEVLLLFAVGAVLMRAAGCIVNDIADRKLDPHVERTKSRPLASGELSLRQAIGFLLLLLFLSFLIALLLGKMVLLWAALALIPVGIYPWMKRISWWPQLYLGLTFNWGALMGWAAIAGTVELPALLLYAGGVFWTLGYDTIYAHQDKNDDLGIGIKSTALYFGARSKYALTVFYTLTCFLWLAAGITAGAHVPYFFILEMAVIHLFTQIQVVNLDSPASCRKFFIANAYQLGPVMFAACLFS